VGLLAGVHAVAGAHGVAETPIPEEAGWRLGAAVAVSAIGARRALPVPFLYGVLDTGQAAKDRQGLTLEHATIDGGLRLNETWGANLAIGSHVGDNAHLEAAWVQAHWQRDDAMFTLGGGRTKVPMGAALSNGGDYDRFTLVPLVKRASLNVDWLDEGVVAAWRPADSSPIGAVELGVWRGTGFPGGGKLPAVPTLHVQAAMADVEVDGFVALLEPTGRGTYAQSSGNPTHSHSVPNCESSLVGLVCFDGRVQVYGASLAWAPHDGPLVLSAAALLRNEQGSLYSQSGDTQYKGQTFGGWVDAVWALDERWELAGRFEALRASQDLVGPGASLVAREAGLIPNQPAYRLAAALAYSPNPSWRLNVEVGADRNGGETTPYAGLRVVWWAPGLAAGNW
jgi:hypothetical protein